ncbi:hypothetical protein A8C32_03860 [Flavivirga aquatica]|uniref:Uncharacterized protein n=1 Tax=Flavivirga aquatica TaxID=1849968 RepID=A0A1E5TB34_9FLAO|nr:hypothetical protein [Flavivirga aquatica]OEK08595.1 hypothetical protein A8C32_03860 [Flavivirga aquatica]
MEKIFNLIYSSNQYKITRKSTKVIFIAPFVLIFVVAGILLVPLTRSYGFWLLEENGPVEMLTFIISMIGGVYGIFFILKNHKILGVGAIIFYSIFSFFLILIAMEEIAWGQWFFHFETPENWAKINVQGETTLHNLKGIQGENGYLRFGFGLGGFFGVLLKYFNRLNKINAPFCLISWFIIFMLWTKLDVLTDRLTLDSGVLNASYEMTELIELLIVGSAFLYLLLNFRMLKFNK